MVSSKIRPLILTQAHRNLRRLGDGVWHADDGLVPVSPAIFMGRGRVKRVGGSKGGDEAVNEQAAEERAVSVIANLMMVPDSLCPFLDPL